MRKIVAHLLYERLITSLLFLSAFVAVLTSFGIVMSIVTESLYFFRQVSPAAFLLETQWSPRFAEAGDGEMEGRFSPWPLLWGTFYISTIALLTAIFFGLSTAIHLVYYASDRRRQFLKPSLELLAGIPTIVYGFFALIFLGPLLADGASFLGIPASPNSAVAAGLTMGIMLIPFISSLSDDVLSALPDTLKDGSLALGSTLFETIIYILIPAASPGLLAAVVLALSRAAGETMIVVMAAGIAARYSLNPFESVTTITVKIVSQLTGDYAFNAPQTLVAFVLGGLLFVITLGMNAWALLVFKRYKEKHAVQA